MSASQFIAVIAVSPSGVIGLNGDMPWKLSTDLKRFKAITMGAPVLMGRKTLESIGRPLPGRRNLVLTRGESHSYPLVEVLSDINAVKTAAAESSTIFVIGGATIYQQLLPLCNTIFLTRVFTQVAGDTVMSLDLQDFTQTFSERVPQNARDSHPTEFQIWRRRITADDHSLI